MSLGGAAALLGPEPLDADALVLQNVDKLLDYPQFCAAPNVYEGLGDFHRMNSGVFTARPDPATFEDMLAKLDVRDRVQAVVVAYETGLMA